MRALPFLGVIALLAGAVPVSAQEEPAREGFWVSLGVGGGWNLARNISDETKPGVAGYVRLGWTVDPDILLGGEAIFWGRQQTSQLFTRGDVALTGLYYPVGRRGLFLKLSLGVAFLDFFPTSDSTLVTTERGFGSNIALGYDLRIGRSVSLTPNVDFVYQRVENATNTMLLITLGVTRQ
ncbi:MAG: hypothetical protein JSW43_11285 [Gemmatimonadota bacterium]|nr:MAG: hypothetical protein JSW43_11285 [Gemmatimonadota bacterium]